MITICGFSPFFYRNKIITIIIQFNQLQEKLLKTGGVEVQYDWTKVVNSYIDKRSLIGYKL